LSILTDKRTHKIHSLRVNRNVKKYGSRKNNIPKGKRTRMGTRQYHKHKDQEIKFRLISKDEAKNQIREYITQHPGSLTSEVIEALRIDPITTADTLEELKREGLVLSQAVE
jgi:hypothetical protein